MGQPHYGYYQKKIKTYPDISKKKKKKTYLNINIKKKFTQVCQKKNYPGLSENKFIQIKCTFYFSIY